MVVRKRGIEPKSVNQFERGCWPEGHPYGYRAIQFDNRRGRELGQLRVKFRNPGPVSLLRDARTRMTGRDFSLEHVRTRRVAKFSATTKRREATLDEDLVPVRTILIEQKDGFSRGADARPQARCLNFHQSDQAMHFRFL